MITCRQIVQILANALPGHRLKFVEPLTDGRRNVNYLLHTEGVHDRLVLRIYTRGAAACEKELNLYRLISERVPLPEVIYANPAGEEDFGPYMLKRYVEGLTFQELKSRGTDQDIAEAAYAIGATLARLQVITFSQAGPIRKCISSKANSGTTTSKTIERCLVTSILEHRLGAEERNQLRHFVSRWLPQLTLLDEERALVHGDFGARNIIVKRVSSHWVVNGVLDWELAFVGSPLWDAARFICFERRVRPVREPHFSSGFSQNGGSLPKNWQEFSRVLNVVSSIESLSRPDLTQACVSDLKNLVIATMAGCDPC